MPQVLKDEVEESIAGAALAVFARKGFRRATMAEIAREARVSTGNIYRYFASKNALFDALVSDAFVARFVGLMRDRADALEGVEDYRALGPGAAFHLVSGELLDFAIGNRLRVVILLGRCQGTRHEGLAERLISDLMERTMNHFQLLRPGLEVTPALRFGLEQIYRNLVVTMVHILEGFDDGPQIREAVDAYSRYHLVGLNSYFE